MDRIKRLLSFNGRASRLEFWRWYLLGSVLSAVIYAASIFVALSEAPGSKAAAAVLLSLMALLLVPTVAVSLRRLHDRNKGPSWFFLLCVAPYVLAGIAATWPATGALALLNALLVMAALILDIWGWVELGFLRGTRGSNRFGPEPSRR